MKVIRPPREIRNKVIALETIGANFYTPVNICVVAAVSEDGFISDENLEIPWDCIDDKTFFYRLTKNSNVIMGLSTYNSIKGTDGCPKLKERINHVVTVNGYDGLVENRNEEEYTNIDEVGDKAFWKNPKSMYHGLMVHRSLSDALAVASALSFPQYRHFIINGQEHCSNNMEKDVFVIGGQQIYEQLLDPDKRDPNLPEVTNIFITRIGMKLGYDKTNTKARVFPNFDESKYEKVTMGKGTFFKNIGENQESIDYTIEYYWRK